MEKYGWDFRGNKVAFKILLKLEQAAATDNPPAKPHPNDYREAHADDSLWVDLTMKKLRHQIIERMITYRLRMSTISWACWINRHTLSRFLHGGTPDINTMRALSWWLKDPDFWRPYKVNDTITKKYLHDESAVPYTGDGVTTSGDDIGEKHPKEKPSNDHRANTRRTQKTRRKSPQ